MFRIIDVGSAGGLHPRWNKIKDKEVLSFDARENFALWSYRTKKTLYITRGKTKSSLYEPNIELLKEFPNWQRFEVIEEVSVNTEALDDLIKGSDFIKIDVQGAEFDILQGATENLESATGIELEVEFVELYKNQVLFSRIDSFLRFLGFRLYQLNPIYWQTIEEKHSGIKPGQLIYADALYLKPDPRPEILEAYNFKKANFNLPGRRTLYKLFNQAAKFLEY